MYCYHCGTEINKDQKFCVRCGVKLNREEAAAIEVDNAPPAHHEQKGTFQHATERVNRLVGEEGSVDVNVKDVFSSVLQKHSKDEAEQLFITGTNSTTPEESAISTSWPKPWLFSRVFAVLALTFILLLIFTIFFPKTNCLSRHGVDWFFCCTIFPTDTILGNERTAKY